MSNDSKVLALKYRPQNFGDLIGQDVVVETITNSIIANKVPNAYLFTGIRGVGKTTIARIVAKALNCPNGIQKECNSKEIFRSVVYFLKNPELMKKQVLDVNNTLNEIKSSGKIK